MHMDAPCSQTPDPGTLDDLGLYPPHPHHQDIEEESWNLRMWDQGRVLCAAVKLAMIVFGVACFNVQVFLNVVFPGQGVLIFPSLGWWVGGQDH